MAALYPEISSLSDYQNSDKAILIKDVCDGLSAIAKRILDIDGEKCFAVPIEYAPIAGLFNKQRILFKHFCDAYHNQDSEICALFNRILFETYIKMLYLIDHPEESKSYRALSFKSHIRILDEIGDNPITNVFKKKFEFALKSNGLTLDEIKSAPKNLGNRSFYDLLKEYMSEKAYAPLYSQPSDSLHSGWNDIRQFYMFYDDDSDSFVIDTDYHAPLKLHYLITVADLFFDGFRDFLVFLKDEIGYILEDTYIKILAEMKKILNFGLEDALITYETNPDSLL